MVHRAVALGKNKVEWNDKNGDEGIHKTQRHNLHDADKIPVHPRSTVSFALPSPFCHKNFYTALEAIKS